MSYFSFNSFLKLYFLTKQWISTFREKYKYKIIYVDAEPEKIWVTEECNTDFSGTHIDIPRKIIYITTVIIIYI